MTNYRTDFLVGAWAIVEKWYESGDRLDLSSIWPEVQHQQRLGQGQAWLPFLRYYPTAFITAPNSMCRYRLIQSMDPGTPSADAIGFNVAAIHSVISMSFGFINIYVYFVAEAPMDLTFRVLHRA